MCGGLRNITWNVQEEQLKKISFNEKTNSLEKNKKIKAKNTVLAGFRKL